MSFQEILNTYKEKSQNERDKGSRFEQLMKRYLLSDPLYANNLSEVWLWNEFPYKDNFGGVDLGIDLVAFTNDEEYWAIQCKFYDEKTNINVDDVSHFIANANRTFKDANNNTVGFSLCLWIDTKKNFGKNAEQLIKNQKIEFNRIGFTKLSKADVDWQKLAKGESGQAVLLAKKEPRAHQQKAINLAREYFKTHDRGKLIMACGTGKTYTALKIVEQTTKNNGFALFLVPSIALLSQTLKAWSADSITRIYPICICSDASSSKVNKTDDTTIDLPFPATTDVETAIRQYHYQRKQQLSRGGGYCNCIFHVSIH